MQEDLVAHLDKYNKKMKNLLKKYQYVIGISIIVLFQFIYEFGWSIDPYLYVNYFMDYSMGFGPRKLIGTLCQLMLPDGLSNEKNILILITLVYVVLAGLVIFIANKFIRILSLSEKRLFLFAILFVALYFLSPARIEYLFVHTNYGRMDTYMLIFAIVFIMSIRIKSWAFYTLSTILMILSCLSHQIFVCTFLPLYCASYVYRIFNEKDWRKELFYSMLSMFVLTCLFCYVQFFPINTYDLNATMQIINERTGKEFDEFIIFYEYYANIKTHFNCLMLSQINRLVIGFIASIVVLMPLFLIFIYLWCTAVRIANDKKYKITIILMNLSFLLCVPAFIFTMDYGRWFAAIIICQFLLIGGLIFYGDKYLRESAICLVDKIRANIFWTIVVIVYIGNLGCFENDSFLPSVETVIRFCSFVRHII